MNGLYGLQDMIHTDEQRASFNAFQMEQAMNRSFRDMHLATMEGVTDNLNLATEGDDIDTDDIDDVDVEMESMLFDMGMNTGNVALEGAACECGHCAECLSREGADCADMDMDDDALEAALDKVVGADEKEVAEFFDATANEATAESAYANMLAEADMTLA